MREPIFQPLPDKPDHPGLEREMLERWEAEGTFAKLQEQNSGGPTFSFVDGPVTANRFSLGSSPRLSTNSWRSGAGPRVEVRKECPPVTQRRPLVR